MSVYDSSQEPPEDLVRALLASPNKVATPSKPSFGIDSPAGLLMSNVSAPLFLYATLSGKHSFWADLLARLPDESFVPPSLDVGCGRGAVLVKVAQRKKALAAKYRHADNGTPQQPVQPVYGYDIFRTTDQTGNSPEATYRNAAALDVADFVVLNIADFNKKMPFTDGAFGLVVSSLALHNADSREGRLAEFREMARVCAPGGRLILVDLHWIVVEHFTEYRAVLKGMGWEDVEVSFAGLRMVFGIMPCQVLIAVRPKLDA